VDDIDRLNCIPGILFLVLHFCRWSVVKGRQVDSVLLSQILHVEERLRPLLHRFQQEDLGKIGAFPRHNCGGATLSHGPVLLLLFLFAGI
jgi:hypothetical protein